MKLYILDKTFELDGDAESVEKIFDHIRDAIADTEYNFSHIIVDGEEIHNDFEIYIEDNIKNIDEIKVVMLTVKEIVRENLLTIDEYIKRATPLINDLSDKFYREPTSEDWTQLSELLGAISFIFETLESIDSMNNLNEIVSNYEVWNEYAREVKSLNEILIDLNSAIENKDTVLIGDLLSYEIIPVFENMKEKLNVLVLEK